jgi:hypothetical protein
MLSFRNALETQKQVLGSFATVRFGGTSLAHELFINRYVVRHSLSFKRIENVTH